MLLWEWTLEYLENLGQGNRGDRFSESEFVLPRMNYIEVIESEVGQGHVHLF